MANRSPKLLAALALALSSVLVLAGCAPRLEADELPAYTVVQHPRDLFGPWEFSYLDGQGEAHPLECSRDGIFDKTHCESEDGLVSFSFGTNRSRPRLKIITVDGSERPMKRIELTMENVRRAWVPADTL